MNNLDKEVDVACKLALEAGQILLKFYEQGTTVSYKEGNEPVTEADKAASDYILNGLSTAFPSDVVVSEEEVDDARRKTASRVWLVDPLDGTKEFILRNGEFSVMIGLMIDGQPMVGAVYQPTIDRLWYGNSLKEAFLKCNGIKSPLKVSDTSDYKKMCMVVSRSHRSSFVDKMATHFGITREIVSGSGGIKLGIIANGEADLMITPSPYSKIWDLCAPEAVLKAAGGEVTDVKGNRLNYCSAELQNLNGVLASNGKCHQKLVNDLALLLEITN